MLSEYNTIKTQINGLYNYLNAFNLMNAFGVGVPKQILFSLLINRDHFCLNNGLLEKVTQYCQF